MIKFWSALLVFSLLVSPLYAADESGVISLFEGTSEEVAPKEADKTSESIFSFLNFRSKEKKEEPNLNVADQQRLSPLEQTAKLAAEGDVNAQLSLGYSYLYGENGAKIDYDKAFEYYARAAMQNDNIGLNNLGSLYYSGIGVDRSPAKAAILFEKAANLGNAEAAVNLAFIKISGNGAPKNPVQAMDWFEKAADKNPTAQFMLGYAYYTGKLRPQNFKEAARLMKLAAASEFDEAQFILALMYVNGAGLPQNYGNAVKYLKLAVSQGSVEAMTTLGEILARGEKYPKDLYTAHIMFNLAAVRGAKDADAKRQVLEKMLKIDEVLQAQSEAERYHEVPSAQTKYVRSTFGSQVRDYIDQYSR